jgi:hypothetical protein
MAVAALALSVGCDKPKEGAGSTGATPAAETPAAAATIELSDDDVPVPEDFIEEATKEIDENNLNAKLDDLEKEIGAE